MALDPNQVLVFKPIDFKVLDKVANARRIVFKDLWDSVGSEEKSSKEEVAESVEKLSHAGFIKVAPASFQDFHTYYVTAEGLTAERQMKRSGPQNAFFVVSNKI